MDWMLFSNPWDVFPLGQFLPIFFPMLVLVTVWTIIWKGLALWKAARSGEKRWFIALLIINTLGVLEILYLYVFSKKHTPPPGQ